MRYVLGLCAIAIACALILVAVLYSPASAGEPVCDFTFDDTVAFYASRGVPVGIVNEDRLDDMAREHGVEKATRGFVIPGNSGLLLGLEVDGCLLPPITMAPKSPEVNV